MKNKRTFFLYVPVALFFLAGLIAMVGLIGGIKSWGWFAAYTNTSLTPAYAVFRSLALLLINWSAVLILWLGFSWSISFSAIAAVLTAGWFWLDRLVLAANPLPFDRSLVPLLLTCVLLVIVFSSLYLIEPGHKAESGDPEPDLQPLPQEGEILK